METEEELSQLMALVSENESLLRSLRAEIKELRKTASAGTLERALMFTEKLLVISKEQLQTAKAIVALSRPGR